MTLSHLGSGATPIYGIGPSLQALPAANNVLHVSNLNEEVSRSSIAARSHFSYIQLKYFKTSNNIKTIYFRQFSDVLHFTECVDKYILSVYLNNHKKNRHPLYTVNKNAPVRCFVCSKYMLYYRLLTTSIFSGLHVCYIHIMINVTKTIYF